MNTGYPPPPGEFMTSAEIVATIRDHWVENLGATPLEAELRAERGFMHMLATDSIREWGFSDTGDTLYEPHHPVPVRAIVYVLVKEKECRDEPGMSAPGMTSTTTTDTQIVERYREEKA